VTSRERFIAAVSHKEPDRVPVFANISAPIAEALGQELGLPCASLPSYLSSRISYTEILTYLGNDAVGVGFTRHGMQQRRLDEPDQRDEWGFSYKKVGDYLEIQQRPLPAAATVEEIDAYQLPDIANERSWDRARRMTNKYRDSYYIIGCMGQTMFETAWNLIGFERFLMDFYTQEAYIIRLLDRLLEFAVECGHRLIDLGVDALWTGDDVGTQEGMLISPDVWRSILKPRMQDLYRSYKQKDADIKIIYHSCGSIVPIIPDLIDVGVDILNPIQPLAKGMDLHLLKKTYGNSVSLFGGVDVQEVMPKGSSSDIEQHVQDRIQAAARGGGFIIAPAHVVQPDTSVVNVKAFYKAVREHGIYPIGNT
jgi:uroporphyrinogen decarboxylase